MIDTSHLSDVQVLACTLYGEARSEPTEGILAVACVIRNRMKDAKHRWPSDYRGVCLQPKQFSCWLPEGGEGNHKKLAGLVEALKNKAATDDRFKECAWIATGVANDWGRDTVKGANHYHTVSLIPRPSWAQKHVPVVQVKNHVFYVL